MAQASQHTLQFGTYTFPNQTFEIMEHRIDIDTPVLDIRRKDGGSVQDGFLKPRTWRINGKVYGTEKGSVHNELITLQKAMHNDGVGASFYYKSDRYAFAQLAIGGMNAQKQQGLYEFLWNVDILLVAKHPYVEEPIVNCETGSRNNDSSVETLSVGGNYRSRGLWTFVAGTWDFSTEIRVDNAANSMFFTYSGPILAGQTLVVDQALGCVLLQEGLTMVDAISHYGGQLFMELEAGIDNDMVINAPTLTFEVCWQNRYYS